ncbi:hypothetical protein D3C78_1442110 [compost metagenome]
MPRVIAVLAGVGDESHFQPIHLLAGILHPACSRRHRHGDLYACALTVFDLRHINDIARRHTTLETIAEQLGVMPESRQVIAGQRPNLSAQGGA